MNEKSLKTLFVMLFFLGTTYVAMSQTGSGLERYDIIISEIMAKPSPTIGLPAVEYVELHNRLPYPVLLQNWKLYVGNTAKKLPNITLDSCGYAVIIAQKYEADFQPFCEQFYTLSSLAITDGGQTLTLYNQKDEVIHHISFKKEWHSENIKQEGGWSLEMIDENWPCAGKGNWDSSTDPMGGTPGRANSIRNTLSDNTPPSVTGVTMHDTVTLRIHFSKPLSDRVLEQEGLVRTTPALEIVRVSEVPPVYSSLDVRFAAPPQRSIPYHLFVEGVLPDCGGNAYPVHIETPFGISEAPLSNDLVINEILTNPMDDPNAEYVEIFNRSSHIIDLKEVKIGYGGDTMPQKAVVAASKGFQLHPGEYVALCRQKEVTLQQYICKDENRLIECDSLPDLAISKGILHLTDRSLRPIDRLEYNEEMHYSKLLSTKGVSLERLYADRPTQDENNWRSAAESAGFGTPGYLNSQAGNAESDATFDVVPEVISPDNDGFEDYAEIICTLPEDEYRVNIVAYNNRGHSVKLLANNVLCGKEAVFRWDGTDENGNLSPAGMYVIQIECWNLRTHQTLRKRKVVSIYR